MRAEIVMENLQMDAFLAISVISYSRGLKLRRGAALLEQIRRVLFWRYIELNSDHFEWYF
jgi:hypothetical protein